MSILTNLFLLTVQDEGYVTCHVVHIITNFLTL